VLDHASGTFSFGGKAGIDSTIKLPEEKPGKGNDDLLQGNMILEKMESLTDVKYIRSLNPDLYQSGLSILIVGIDPSEDPEWIDKAVELLRKNHQSLPSGL